MTARLPLSTYRLQLHAGFPFEEARAVCDYLADLGVSDVYVSPILRAERGSRHGYNVCAYDTLNPELGGDAGFLSFSDEMKRRGLRLLVDFVPNHMGIASGENAPWNDVLENGPSSRFADFFDIDWESGKASLRARVLLPILGSQYGDALENGELALVRAGGTFVLRYFEHALPVAPRSLLPLLELAAEMLRREGAPEDDIAELLSIATATRNLPDREETAPERKSERSREKEIIKRRLETLATRDEAVARVVDLAVVAFNGKKGDPQSFDRLDMLLQAQSYRLSYWRVATEEINYRRFFDLNALAAVRMELAPVFAAAHARILALIADGRIDGLRLDHTDGLLDPAEYLARLREAAGSQRVHVVIEKILERGERVPGDWQVDGTTGYDSLSLLSGLWVDSAAEPAFTSLYRRVTGDDSSFEAHVGAGKRDVIEASFSPELNMLSRALERIAEGSRRSRDFTRASLRDALVATIAAFPVYRTYLRANGARGPSDDRRIALAIAAAKRREPNIDGSVFDFVRDVLLLQDPLVPGGAGPRRDELRTSFALRFQQLTGPIMAKGVEDTAFYRYTRFAALNEVGGDPAHFGTSLQEFHEATARRARDWPLTLVATSTHDTKRGEDHRARLAVLSERPARWEAFVDRAFSLAEKHRRAVDDVAAPNGSDVYLFLQSALGAWPFAGLGGARSDYAERLRAYMEKVVREAKLHGSWLRPSEEYEEAMKGLVEGLLGDEEFVRELQTLADETATYAATNALASVALKITGPGVADTYQGSELWNFALVDPDNRSDVDFGVRRAKLRAIREAERDRRSLVRSLLDTFRDGGVKLYVTHRLLTLRRELAGLHLSGSYTALDGGEHVVAFLREHEGQALACVVPRLPWKLTDGRVPWALGEAWGDRSLSLPAKRWTNVFTGERRAWSGRAPMGEILESFPVAVLTADGS